MSEKLLPCPFCGGNPFIATIEHSEESRPHGYRFYGNIMCINCQAKASTKGFDLDYDTATEKAIKAWNTRSDHLADVNKMIPMQLWEAGSEPPDGFYWYFNVINDAWEVLFLVVFDSGNRALSIMGVEETFAWTDEILLGPLPDPVREG